MELFHWSLACQGALLLCPPLPLPLQGDTLWLGLQSTAADQVRANSFYPLITEGLENPALLPSLQSPSPPTWALNATLTVGLKVCVLMCCVGGDSIPPPALGHSKDLHFCPLHGAASTSFNVQLQGSEGAVIPFPWPWHFRAHHTWAWGSQPKVPQYGRFFPPWQSRDPYLQPHAWGSCAGLLNTR